MKVENEIVAPCDGTVLTLNGTVDDAIEDGAIIVTLQA